MSNSSLVELVGLSPYHYTARTRKIDRITPHCIVGNFDLERLPMFFDDEECSCNYAIAKDGRIALIVDESQGAWCSSSYENDDRAVTIECSSLATHPYTFPNEVYESLANLTVDIMIRNGLNKLLYFPDKNTALAYVPKEGECVLTFHRWFANKACPGDWFVEKAPVFTDYVNQKLSGALPITPPKRILYKVQIGAFKNLNNAIAYEKKAESMGFDAFYFQDEDTLYKVQIGAYAEVENARKLEQFAKQKGFNAFTVSES